MRISWILSSLALTGLFIACGNDSPDVSDDDAAGSGGRGDGGAEPADGDGDQPEGDGDDAPVVDPDPDGPIYGEEETALETLRLKFKEVAVAGASNGTDFVFLPDEDTPKTSEFLMVTRANRFLHVALESGAAELLDSWTLEEEIYSGEACSTTNLALDPDFKNNHFVYISYCPSESVSQLVRYEWQAGAAPKNPTVIYEATREGATKGWHRIGSIGFEEDGTLWMLVGDHEASAQAQDPSDPLGALVRIIPNRDKGGEGHTIPEGNWAAQEGAPEGTDPSVFAIGLRSPWRGTLDASGRYWFADVGDGRAEEVNLVTGVGQNFGWDEFEGPCETDCGDFVNPIAHYDRSEDHPYLTEQEGAMDNSKRAIWMGEIYQSPSIDRYQGLMDDVAVFGDLFTGAVRGLRVDANGVVTMDQALGVLSFVTAWRTGTDGYAYALDLSGQIHVALLDSSME